VCILLPTLITAACLGTPEEFQDTGVIVFQNETQVSITDVRVAVCSDTAFGTNLMGNLLEVPPGRDFRVRVSPGCWDARLGFNEVIVMRTNITVREDDETIIRLSSLQ
jgi:hypothetical protein